MQKIAAIILENDSGELLLALRDKNPTILFPNCWDLIGEHVEKEKLQSRLWHENIKKNLDLRSKSISFSRNIHVLKVMHMII